MRRAAAVLLAAATLASCAEDPPLPPRASVVRSGHSIRGEQLGTGAIVRVTGERVVQDIDLVIEFYADGARLGTERDRLPFCPPSTDCPWGQRLFGDHLGERWRSIDRVEVKATGHGGPMDRPPGIRTTDVRIERGAAALTPPAEGGTVYLLAFDGDTPRFGYSFFAGRGEGKRFRFSQTLFPRLKSDRLRAYLYPSSAPARE